MSVSAATPREPANPAHDRGYHALPIKQIVTETDEAVSLVFDIPAELAASYAYQAGQFLTFRISVDGQTLYRSYSMSSAPATDTDLAVTVKRVPGGRASSLLTEQLHAGDTVDASVPAGVFRLTDTDRDLVAFAAGSGVTPIFSLIKQALATTSRNVRLFYANRDTDAVIFAAELERLAAAHPDQLDVVHRLDVEDGFADAAAVAPYLEDAKRSECYICGPAPFMDVIETALLDGGVPVGQIHIERFTVVELAPPVEAAPPSDPGTDAATGATEVTIELDGKTKTATHRPGTTILQIARSMGFSPPFSCEAGNCATCMAKLVEGEVTMRVNDALFEDEIADGWILTCQSEPTTPTVHVIYGED